VAFHQGGEGWAGGILPGANGCNVRSRNSPRHAAPDHSDAARIAGRVTAGAGGALPLACTWPFPAGGERTSPEVRRAALNVLRTTARDWGLAPR
jgi:hypothetical protein